MKPFYHLLANSLIANVTNFFIWATVIFWAYLETNSVLATSIISGIYLVLTATCGFWFGSIVDHNKKKVAMIISSLATLAFFGFGLFVYSTSNPETFADIGSVRLWVIAISLLFGVVAGNIRMIALPTAVKLLVPEEDRARANGMSGVVMGISFAVSNVSAGVGLGFLGMSWVITIGIGLMLLTIIHLLFIKIPEEGIVEAEGVTKSIDIIGTFKVVKAIPGLLALIFFTTFNNFLGGVFMSLMDAYGLTLVSVQVWGTLWGITSLGFILGGLYIAKKGVGKNPVKTLFRVNMVIWAVSIFMTIQPSIWLLMSAMFVYVCLMPFIEASEQTVIQKVVPQERLGRVFGFAQSVEQSASPISAFVVGPIAHFVFIPFMTTGAGVELIGSWYGVGMGRGIGLVFSVVGVIGLIVTIFASRSRSAKNISEKYLTGV